jgi:hypothetical protein
MDMNHIIIMAHQLVSDIVDLLAGVLFLAA